VRLVAQSFGFGNRELFQIELDHHVFGNLPALGGAILHALKSAFYLGDAALEPVSQGFVGQCRADDGRDDLVQVRQALNGVQEGLLIDAGVFRPDPIANRAVGDGGKFEPAKAFLFPAGAPDPGAPPCMRQRFFPPTAGDLQDPPERVRAPQRILKSMDTTLRLCALVTHAACALSCLERALGAAQDAAW
jgi:hypothetical protein